MAEKLGLTDNVVFAGWVRDRVAYVPGATEVQTSAQEAWDKEQGVCQDIAHLTVALLRENGLPARYVSGYLHADPAPHVAVNAVTYFPNTVVAWAVSRQLRRR